MTKNKNSPIEIRQSKIPALVLIADGFTKAGVAGCAVEAARAGAPWVHLRDHAAGEDAFAEAACELTERLRQSMPGEGRVSVNSRPDVAEALGAGLHTGRHGPSPGAARERFPGGALVGASAHGRDEGEAVQGAADYFFFSPVFPTTSKPGHPGAGLEALRDFCHAVPDTPVFALGGITPQRVAACLDAGAHGVAVLSGILHADDPQHATRAYLQALRDA